MYWLSLAVLAQGLVTLGLCVAGSFYGESGVAGAYLVAGVVQLAISMGLNGRIVGRIAWADWSRIGRDALIQATLVLALAGGVALWLRHLQAPSLVIVFIAAVVCGVLYGAALLAPPRWWGADLRWAVAMLGRAPGRD